MRIFNFGVKKRVARRALYSGRFEEIVGKFSIGSSKETKGDVGIAWIKKFTEPFLKCFFPGKNRGISNLGICAGFQESGFKNGAPFPEIATKTHKKTVLVTGLKNIPSYGLSQITRENFYKHGATEKQHFFCDFPMVTGWVLFTHWIKATFRQTMRRAIFLAFP